MPKVKEYREAFGISTETAAKIMGITRPTYVSREKGLTQFTKNEMEAFVNYLQSRVDSMPISIQNIFFE